MAELTPRERLQPSLIDRLTDDAPDKKQEPRDQRVLTMTQLRRSVLRELGWLFNTSNLESAQDLENYPFVRHSVANYGMPDLTGHSVEGMTPAALEATVRRAIIDFEPRILASSIRVRALVNRDEMNRNAIIFEIEGELWGQPASTHLYVRTELDIDTGKAAIKNGMGG